MKKHKLHIVTFDVPVPPDYGGAIDVFYKIKSLYEAGAEIYLHCFIYDRPKSDILEKMCAKVWYYPRMTGWRGMSLTLPYIVYSRRSKELLKNLQHIDAPILFEGVHTTYYLSHPSLKNRLKYIRTHNIEHDYYAQLAANEDNAFKRNYYQTESRLLKRYESDLWDAQGFFSLSQTDHAFFMTHYPNATGEFIAPFHSYENVSSLVGTGKYCLYHGNLSHRENIDAVYFLAKEIIPHIDMPVIIAGRKPTPEVKEILNQLPNCTLYADPSLEQMNKLIKDAHIHLLPTFQRSGMKLKLLYSLFGGRHVIANKNMLYGTGLDAACHIAESASAFIEQVNILQNLAFTEKDIDARKELLAQHYSDRNNAAKLLTYLQP